MTHQRHEFPFTFDLKPQHAKTGIDVVKSDALNQTVELLEFLGCKLGGRPGRGHAIRIVCERR
jgi:hypothetical protein